MRLLRQFWACDRTVQFLLLNHLAMMLGFSMLLPYVTGYLSTTLGFAVWMVGLVLGLRTFSQQGLGVIGGILADHWGYKPLIAAGCALRVAGFLLFGFCQTLPGALGAAFLSGLGGALFEPCNPQNYGCVPLSTHGVFNRAVRLMMPIVVRNPRAVMPNPSC